MRKKNSVTFGDRDYEHQLVRVWLESEPGDFTVTPTGSVMNTILGNNVTLSGD